MYPKRLWGLRASRRAVGSDLARWGYLAKCTQKGCKCTQKSCECDFLTKSTASVFESKSVKVKCTHDGCWQKMWPFDYLDRSAKTSSLQGQNMKGKNGLKCTQKGCEKRSNVPKKVVEMYPKRLWDDFIHILSTAYPQGCPQTYPQKWRKNFFSGQ